MCPSCDRLRAELREVKEELAEWQEQSEGVSDDETALLMAHMKLSPQKATLVSAFMGAASRMISTDKLIELMDYRGLGRDDMKNGYTDEGRALKVVICQIRKNLESFGIFEAICVVWGAGYIMPRSKANEIRKLLEAA